MTSKRPSLATAIAPEDLRRGDYVAVLNVILQLVPFCLDSFSRVEPVPVRLLPFEDPEPLEVLDICLPFVSVRKPSREVVTLDLRRHELARLDDAYARRVARQVRRKDQGLGKD